MQSHIYPRPQGVSAPSVLDKYKAHSTVQLLEFLIVINNLFYSSIGGKGLGKAVCPDLEQEDHQNSSDMAANAPEM